MLNDPLIGCQLANYRIDRLIGRGGMASVYHAMDVKLNRAVAVKIIDSRFQGNPAYTARFLQEARAVATWRHEHIIQVYYAGDQDGLFYFAMEFIDGSNLAEVLSHHRSAGKRMPYDEILRFGRAVAEALDYAHQKGVIHRDVKPANVLISGEGRIVLGDFGLALDTQQGSLGEVFGTAHYTAPEQARRSNAAVPQSDLYSLGIMLYEMLTGRVPFDDPSPTSVALQHITLPPVPPSQVDPSLPEGVDKVLLKALEKEPTARYQSGVELLDALSRVLDPAQQDIPPRKISLRPARAGWVLASSGACLLLFAALVVVAVVWVFLKGQIPPPQVAILSTKTTYPADLPADILFSTPAQHTPSGLTPSLPPATTAPPATVPINSPSPVLSTSTLAAKQAASSTASPTTILPAKQTDSPTPPLPSPTSRFWNGRKFILYYNDTSFYMLQVGGFGGLIAPSAFERLDSAGLPSNRFDGDAWAEYHTTTLAGWCMRLEILNAGSYLQPASCGDHYMASRWPAKDDKSIFWTAQEGSSQFRVLWGTEEAGRCDIAAGTCEVYLP